MKRVLIACAATAALALPAVASASTTACPATGGYVDPLQWQQCFNQSFNQKYNQVFDLGFNRGFTVAWDKRHHLVPPAFDASKISAAGTFATGFNLGFDRGWNA